MPLCMTKLAAFAPLAALLLASTTASAESSLGVSRLVTAHGIDAHEPQAPATTFKANDDRVYAFVEVKNATKASEVINVVFESPKGSEPAIEIPLTVGPSQHFRTWAFTRKAHTPGEWNVVVRDSHHRVLSQQKFTVE